MRGTVEKKRICVYVKQETVDYINKVATEIDRSQGWVVDEAIKKMRVGDLLRKLGDSEPQAHNNNK